MPSFPFREPTFGQRLGGAVVDAVLWLRLPLVALLTQVWSWLPALAVAVYEIGLDRRPLGGGGDRAPRSLDLGWTALVFMPVLQPPRHRGLHDRAAATVVTSVRLAPALSRRS